MTDTPPEGPSLDPKTWLRAGIPAVDDPAATSFDPKTWRRDDTAAPPAPPAAPKRAGRRSLAIGAVAVAALLCAGGAWLLLSGRPKPGAQAPAAAVATGVERRALTVSRPEEILGALAGAGVAQGDAAKISALATSRMTAGAGDITVVMMLSPTATGAALISLDARHDDGAGVIVKRAEDGSLSAQPTAADLKTVVKVVRGEMDAYSFYSSAVAQHLTDSLISPFAQALAFDFDFQREIHAGDIFEAAYEDRENAKGESVGVGRLLYVSLETPTKSRALYWFQPKGGEAGWYDGNGASVVRALMRTPVESARISSTFGMRVHPVLGFMKLHTGIDFAAPIGTPIYAAGDGAIEYLGPKGTAGNVVQIKHDNGWETWYYHMSAFGPGLVMNGRVRQGQQIGAIGTTGRSTGPHLHYEVHVGGQPVDPTQLKMDGGHALAGDVLKAFTKERDRIDALRAAQTG